MSLLFPVWIALLPVLIAALVAVALFVRAAGTDVSHELRRLRRRAAWFTLAAGVAGAAALVLLGSWKGPGGEIRSAITPATVGVTMVLVILVHELTWPRPQQRVRSASLVRRTWLSSAPRWLLVLGVLGFVTTWVIDVVGWLVAGPDGRSLARTVNASETTSAGPFPGSHYAVPTMAVTLVLVLVTALTLSVIAGRTAVPEADQDQAFRRLSAHRALRGAVFGLLATAAGLAYFAGHAVRNVYQDSPVPHALGLVLLGYGLVLGLTAVVALVWPSRGLRTPAPAAQTA